MATALGFGLCSKPLTSAVAFQNKHKTQPEEPILGLGEEAQEQGLLWKTSLLPKLPAIHQPKKTRAMHAMYLPSDATRDRLFISHR